MKFIALAEEYLQLCVYSKDTESKIRTSAKLFAERGEADIADLTIAAIGRFKSQTLSVAKPITYNGYLRYLRLLGDYAVERGYLTTNYFRLARQGTVPTNTYKCMEDDTVLDLLKHIEQEAELYEPVWFWRAVIYTLYFTGMRRKQLVFLRGRDVDFERNSIALKSAGSKTQREWEIPMHPLLRAELITYYRLVETDTCRHLIASDSIFNISRHNGKFKSCAQHPDQMPSRAITDFFKRVNKRAQLGVSAHKFRHTLATKLCNPEVGDTDIFAVQQILGHTMIQTTRQYVKTSLNRMNCVLDKITFP